MTWDEEVAAIKAGAASYGVPWEMIAAIRKAEWGPPPHEFGVLDPAADTYDKQLAECCATVRNFLGAHYTANPLSLTNTSAGHRVLCLDNEAILAFADQWAPVGAANDPDNLNTNWVHDFKYWYFKLLAEAHPAPARL